MPRETERPRWSPERTRMKRSYSRKMFPSECIHFDLWKTFHWKTVTCSDDLFYFLNREVRRQRMWELSRQVSMHASTDISFTVCGSGDNRPGEQSVMFLVWLFFVGVLFSLVFVGALLGGVGLSEEELTLCAADMGAEAG